MFYKVNYLFNFFLCILCCVNGNTYSDADDNFVDDYPFSSNQYSDDFTSNCIALKSKDSGSFQYSHEPFSKPKCWFIQSNQTVFITISITKINIPSNGIEHCNDYLRIHSISNNGNSYNHYLCDAIYSTFAVIANEVELYAMLQSDYSFSSETKYGFSLQYAIEPRYNDVVVHSFVFITTPDYIQVIDTGNVTVSWNISSASSLPLQFEMNDWTVYHGGVIQNYVLRIYDGQSNQSKLLGDLNSYQWKNFKTISSGPYLFFEYHIIASEKTRFFRGLNATIKVKGYCLPGTSPCGDDTNCYSSRQSCDGKSDCSTNLDEKGCLSRGCSEDEFWCGFNQNACYSEEQRCNGKDDCSRTKIDEFDCSSCMPGNFYCKLSRTCIYESWRCDGQEDCPNREDEQDCLYTPTRRVMTAAIVGCLVCGLLLAIALGCGCKLYTLRSAAYRRQRRNRMVQSTPLGRIARRFLQQEAPPSYNMTVNGVENSSEGSRRRSSSSRRRRERRRRRRNREPRIRRAQPLTGGTGDASTVQACNRDNHLPSENSQPNSRHASNASVEDVEQSSNPSGANQSNMIDVRAYVLAEMGLAGYPNETQLPRQSSSTVADQPSTSSSTAVDLPPEGDQQADPLPKKKKIRPVMVEAPFTTVMVDDIPGCLYPNPPSYHEAVISDDQIVPPSIPRETPPDNGEDKSKSSSKTILEKLWPKNDPEKKRSYFKFPFPSIFNLKQANGRIFDASAGGYLDDDQLQLINDFASERDSQRNESVSSTLELSDATSDHFSDQNSELLTVETVNSVLPSTSHEMSTFGSDTLGLC